MDKEHVKGATDSVVGKTKEVAGHFRGNKNLETECKVDRVKGLYTMRPAMRRTPAKRP